MTLVGGYPPTLTHHPPTLTTHPHSPPTHTHPPTHTNAYAGAMRGAGLQALGMVCNVVTYWVAGAPLACVLAFWGGMGVRGMWIAMSSAVAVQAVVLLTLLMRQDWGALADAAGERVDMLVTGGGERVDMLVTGGGLGDGGRGGDGGDGGGGGHVDDGVDDGKA